jgi:hypothetical protein
MASRYRRRSGLAEFGSYTVQGVHNDVKRPLADPTTQFRAPRHSTFARTASSELRSSVAASRSMPGREGDDLEQTICAWTICVKAIADRQL